MIKKKVEGATDARSCTNTLVRDMGGNYVLVVKNRSLSPGKPGSCREIRR